MANHWAREQLKRIVIRAMIDYKQGAGMSVTAGIAADKIIDLMAPTPEQIAERQAAWDRAFQMDMERFDQAAEARDVQ